MIVRAYLRVADDGRVRANDKPDLNPLVKNGEPMPTAAFALDLDIPDEQFKLAEKVLAEVKVMQNLRVAADVVYPERIDCD